MEQARLAETVTLVVQIEKAADGMWYLHVEGAQMSATLPLVPATFIMQVWRASDAKVLRATIQLHGSRHTAAIQSNAQLIELVQAWLSYSA